MDADLYDKHPVLNRGSVVTAEEPRGWSFGEDPSGPRSVDAFDNAEVALEAVGEFGQRFLVGRAP
ncbi:hypothetical protein, partial [Nocardia rhamnosiphila]|uniref:hypothetical protein n=1 Tax=Nocardia rhamnosiphila TaxID=426716 RepID=UPI001C3FA4C6